MCFDYGILYEYYRKRKFICFVDKKEFKNFKYDKVVFILYRLLDLRRVFYFSSQGKNNIFVTTFRQRIMSCYLLICFYCIREVDYKGNIRYVIKIDKNIFRFYLVNIYYNDIVCLCRCYNVNVRIRSISVFIINEFSCNTFT